VWGALGSMEGQGLRDCAFVEAATLWTGASSRLRAARSHGRTVARSVRRQPRCRAPSGPSWQPHLEHERAGSGRGGIPQDVVEAHGLQGDRCRSEACSRCASARGPISVSAACRGCAPPASAHLVAGPTRSEEPEQIVRLATEWIRRAGRSDPRGGRNVLERARRQRGDGRFMSSHAAPSIAARARG
jgi:hypothetical protein